MADGDEAVPRRLGRRRVAHVARPRLQVAGSVAGPRGTVHGERHAEALAQRAAVRLVLVGLLAQAVVDVQGAHRALQRDRHVEQADRVAPARQQHHDVCPGAQQAGGPHAVEQVLSHRRSAEATNSSVA